MKIELREVFSCCVLPPITREDRTERSIQLLCVATYNIWCRDVDTYNSSADQTCRCSKKMERSMLFITTEAELQTSGQKKDEGHSHYPEHAREKWSWTGHDCRVQDDRWIACKLETIWDERITGQTS